MHRKSRVWVQTTPLSSMSAYTPHPSLQLPNTHNTTVFTVYIHITPMSSVYLHTPYHGLLYLRTHTPSSQSTYTHTHIHRLHSLRTHHNTVFTLPDNDVQSPYDSEHGRGGPVWVSTIFSLLLTGKIGADKAAHNLVTPKMIFRPEWRFGQTGLLKTTLHKKEPFLQAYLKI
jgi:hypothetical protein